jgi:hypothetical protein
VNRNARYITVVAKSNDLIHWKYGDKAVFDANEREGINNSDVDLVESNGVVHFLYLTGDQLTWGNLKKAVYVGSMKQFFSEFDYLDKPI